MLIKKSSYQSVLFVLLLVSGTLKNFAETYVGGVDIALLMAVIVLLDIIVNKVVIPENCKDIFFLFSVFTLYIVISMGYSNSTFYLFEKFRGYILNILYFTYPFFIRKIDVKKFIYTYLLIIVPLAIFFIQRKTVVWDGSDSSETFMDLRSAYLAISYHLGIIMIILAYYRKNIYIVLFLLGLIFATSARGPFIFAALTLIIIYFKSLKGAVKNFSKYIPYVLGTIWIPIVIIYKYQDSIIANLGTAFSRYTSLEHNDRSLGERVKMFEYAYSQPFDKITTFIFGNGFGSFGVNFTGIDQRGYPHNIVLEVFYELGIIGVFVFLIFLYLIIRKTFKNKNVFLYIIIFTLLNALKSYTISDLWIQFAFLGCIVRDFKEYDNKKYLY